MEKIAASIECYMQIKKKHGQFLTHLLFGLQWCSPSDKLFGEFPPKAANSIHPKAKSVFGIDNLIGLFLLTQLRVGLSKLYFHQFRHSFKDAMNAICLSNEGAEDEKHFLLLCFFFDRQRRSLLDRV